MLKRRLMILIIGACFCGMTVPCQMAQAEQRLYGEAFSSILSHCKQSLVTFSHPATDLIEAFYRQTGHFPAWEEGKRFSSLLQEIHFLADDGIAPWFYFPLIRLADDGYCRDIIATHIYLRALYDLRYGRLTPPEPEAIWRYKNDSLRYRADALLAIAVAGLDEVNGAFAQARPAHPLYQQLRQAYRKLRDQTSPWGVIANGPTLEPGQHDARVPAVAMRLAAQGYDGFLSAGAGLTLYAPDLAEAIKRFQGDHGIKVDGIIGPQTRGELNISRQQRLDQMVINLERLRWYFGESPPEQVVVDIAGARVGYYRQHQRLLVVRAQVGRPSRPTPSLESVITHFTYHPTWTVPPTIFRKDKLPQIRRDLHYLAANHIRVFDKGGKELDPEKVDWRSPIGVVLRQDAGPYNALGEVALRFPNPFLVYLHDTPSKALFERIQRNFSSGCVRVENAMAVADLILSGQLPEIRERAESYRHGQQTRNLSLTTPVSLISGYWTVDGADDGTPRFKPDIYQRDLALIQYWYSANRLEVDKVGSSSSFDPG